jgi:hypothetical protein
VGLQGQDVATDANTQFVLHGIALGVDVEVVEPNLTVLGVTVTTNAQTHFAGPVGGANGAAAFFSQAANHVVRVRGSFSGGVLTAHRAQIEH